MDNETRQAFDQISCMFDEVNNKFDKIDSRFDEVNNRLDGIDQKIDNKIDDFAATVNKSFDGLTKEINYRFWKTDQRFDKLDEQFKDNKDEVAALHSRVSRIETAPNPS